MISPEGALRHKIDNKTKPPGALGMLEELALRIGTILGTDKPALCAPHIVVFAADHGIAATGLVNPYPMEVTAQMVHNFLRGGAAINVFCRLNGIQLRVVNAGVRASFADVRHDDFIDAPVAEGSADYRLGDAMTEAQLQNAFAAGSAIVGQIANAGCNCIGFGEMGIGNSSSAALLMHAITKLPLEACVGAGTGAQGEALHTKLRTLQEVAATHQLAAYDGGAAQLLQQVGGFEIAMMAAAYLQAAKRGMVIVVDGFIATAALLVAAGIERPVIDNCVFAHSSAERGHEALLRYLGGRPLLHLGLRLGEGTGAALAIPLLQAATAFLNEMASFESAGVSNKS
ncbi:nicotinate-nucleotide--dimethylbenzimidazole phosphoribosyltransferase [Flaviaesturariibacter flavus]|uniref:Nicotinate-nucleotide--dimethylbenzimidazole phosphoribosyltransferase n=1 Tax=Flaviaesturariibacter flavus TaxID=2502780 RepID=A0A4R1BB92_9BACT|nr:nicotinate-nucleotide--dimethylbenzimidazole phosphoribosyltransferase [Flaviaesturariibacter flavus]TCJ14249.1 nicotinate-nucleotide--dimethylbenzimidazole phosphoribosyltransferase [Flaviaesturariibacter flavus]